MSPRKGKKKVTEEEWTNRGPLPAISDLLENAYGDGVELSGRTEIQSPQLITTDDECVWQQLKALNRSLVSSLKSTKALLNSPLCVTGLDELPEEDPAPGSGKDSSDADSGRESASELPAMRGSMDDEEAEDTDEEQDSSHHEDGETRRSLPTKGRASIVDDEFFKLADMEAFLEAEERRTTETHLLDDVQDDVDPAGGAYKYEDFFGPRREESSGQEKGEKRKKSVRFDEEVTGEESEQRVLLGEEHDDEPISSFQLRQQRLEENIRSLESANLAPRGWQLEGEIAASGREQNTLLEEHVAFEHSAKLVPVITAETTERLEALIVQRIKDKAFDDVQKTTRPAEAGSARYRNERVDDETVKQSLVDVYEKEFHKNQGVPEEDKSKAKEEEIEKRMTELFAKLDALSHLHFVPKEMRAEVKIVNNMPSLNMEEVGALASSDAVLLAPEEVQRRIKGDVKTDEEKTRTDRLRERRRKKTAQAVGKGLKRKKEMPAGERREGKKAKREKTSGNFFHKLQEEVQTAVSSNKRKQKGEKEKKRNASVKFKL